MDEHPGDAHHRLRLRERAPDRDDQRLHPADCLQERLQPQRRGVERGRVATRWSYQPDFAKFYNAC